eukprot:229583-Hanusia_phi.AAC.1
MLLSFRAAAELPQSSLFAMTAVLPILFLFSVETMSSEVNPLHLKTLLSLRVWYTSGSPSLFTTREGRLECNVRSKGARGGEEGRERGLEGGEVVGDKGIKARA